jgi:hypothetical protein
VIACRATTVQDFNNELTTNGLIDGGVIYFGHAGRVPASGTLFSALFIGQDPVVNENLYAGSRVPCRLSGRFVRSTRVDKGLSAHTTNHESHHGALSDRTYKVAYVEKGKRKDRVAQVR